MNTVEIRTEEISPRVTDLRGKGARLIYAAGVDKLLLSCILYAPAAALYFKARHERGLRVFRPAEAVLFGVTHGYQGVESCLRITVYGLLFGLLASWRRSLRPGMLAHALTDVLAGLLRI